MYKRFGKRLIDIIVSSVGMVIFAFIFIPVSIAIYLEDKGPIFYNASRLGKDGKVFKMYKFRSMKVNAPDIRKADGSTYNGEDDPRLTKIGKFIRKTSIDEIPQIINVFKGDMSLIGPRPDLPEAVYQYTKKEKNKLNIRPGITGYSQAYFRNSINMKEKFKIDVFYVDNLSILMDVKILFKTFSSVLFKQNIFNLEEIKAKNITEANNTIEAKEIIENEEVANIR